MLVFALLSVFIAGLMVGRTPEYLGKKIQAPEMKLVVLYLIAVPLCVLAFSATSVLLDTAKASILNPGPTGSRDHLRVHVRSEQQRLRIRWAHDEHRLVQHDAGHRDAHRPVPADGAALAIAGRSPRRSTHPRRPARSRRARRCPRACSSASC
jgi:hypothetical protein